MSIRLLLVDDHTIFRSGLKRLFQDEPDIAITGEAANAGDALGLLRRQAFDLVLLDISLAGRSGLELLASLRADGLGTPVLVLSMYPEQQYALPAIQAGAMGYLPKDAEPDELLRAIRRVAGGAQYLSAQAAALVRQVLQGDDQRLPHERLSVREHQIMQMLVKGMSLTDIGLEMMISVKTVSTHRGHILDKLGVGSNAELVLYAVRQGLVS
ncbi:response regulator [Pseudaquabacterium pictum]|uniref:DNA-binding response regulator n=1 Tax=Pseudaquabacterium pictum TaxID=2315236 RepID=A0A480AVR0_9BURK|nr:response regulator transcription factor [Rubrivivax pictus]GCL65000.1 DNA-binding response regulator [Rubrivivax pictus]